MWHSSSQHMKLPLRLIKLKYTTPLNHTLQTDTPCDSYCFATPCTIFHNFTLSSSSPWASVASDGNPIMYAVTFICLAQAWEHISGFPLYVHASLLRAADWIFESHIMMSSLRNMLCHSSPFPAATGSGCFATDVTRWEAEMRPCRVLSRSKAKRGAWK